MTRQQWLQRFERERLRSDPKASPLFIDKPAELMKLPWFGQDYMPISQIEQELHTGFRTVIAILAREKLVIYRIPTRKRFRYFTRREFLPLLVSGHGSHFARERRARRNGRNSDHTPLRSKCLHCGKEDRQWRCGRSTAGKQCVRCGYCNKYYTIGANRRQPLQATCKWCGATTHQRRRGFSGPNQIVQCVHCLRHYVLQGDHDHTPPQKWVSRRRLTPEEELVELRNRFAAGPTDCEIELGWRRLLAGVEAYADRLVADLQARQGKYDQEMRDRTARCDKEYWRMMEGAVNKEIY